MHGTTFLISNDVIFDLFACVETETDVEFYSYIAGRNQLLIFLENILKEVFGKLLINRKETVFSTDTCKESFVFEIYSKA